MAGQGQAAENQHYVPKLILRNFLQNEEKERVSVLSKSGKREFITSIGNIMAERRFNEFRVNDDFLASFEDAASNIEGEVAPTYSKIVETRKLPTDARKRTLLAVFVAFQFVRTRGFRDQFKFFDEQLKDKIERMGGSITDVKGYEPLTEDILKKQHLGFVKDSIGKFAEIIAAKEFFLMEPPEGRSFYLGDNPVCLHNSSEQNSPYGNIGLAVRGIEIYCPLSHDLCLAAWCPTIVEKLRQNVAENRRTIAKLTLSPSAFQKDSSQIIAEIKTLSASLESYLSQIVSDNPITLDGENMDFLNTLQVGTAREFLICKSGNFKLAREFIDQEGVGDGKWMTLG